MERVSELNKKTGNKNGKGAAKAGKGTRTTGGPSRPFPGLPYSRVSVPQVDGLNQASSGSSFTRLVAGLLQ